MLIVFFENFLQDTSNLDFQNSISQRYDKNLIITNFYKILPILFQFLVTQSKIRVQSSIFVSHPITVHYPSPESTTISVPNGRRNVLILQLCVFWPKGVLVENCIWLVLGRSFSTFFLVEELNTRIPTENWEKPVRFMEQWFSTKLIWLFFFVVIQNRSQRFEIFAERLY